MLPSDRGITQGIAILAIARRHTRIYQQEYFKIHMTFARLELKSVSMFRSVSTPFLPLAISLLNCNEPQPHIHQRPFIPLLQIIVLHLYAAIHPTHLHHLSHHRFCSLVVERLEKVRTREEAEPREEAVFA